MHLKQQSSSEGRAGTPLPAFELVTFTNEISLDHDGWAQLAPFGDYPGEAI